MKVVLTVLIIIIVIAFLHSLQCQRFNRFKHVFITQFSVNQQTKEESELYSKYNIYLVSVNAKLKSLSAMNIDEDVDNIFDDIYKESQNKLSQIPEPPKTIEEIEFLIDFSKNVNKLRPNLKPSENNNIKQNIDLLYNDLIDISKQRDIYSEHIDVLLYYVAVKMAIKHHLLNKMRTVTEKQENMNKIMYDIRKEQKEKYLNNFYGKTYDEYLQYAKENNLHPIRMETFNKLINIS